MIPFVVRRNQFFDQVPFFVLPANNIIGINVEYGSDPSGGDKPAVCAPLFFDGESVSFLLLAYLS